MPAREVPRPQWPLFLGNFGFRHFGWDATLEQKVSGRGKLIEADDWFLEELTSDRAGGHEQITIVLGSPFRPFHTHVVSNPKHVRVAAGHQAALEIDSEDGSSVIVHLQQPGHST